MASITSNFQWTPWIVGAVLAFILGWVWYLPQVFGKPWAKALGVELGSVSSVPIPAMLTNIVGLLGVSWVGTLLGGDYWTWGLVIVAFTILNFSGALFAKIGMAANWVNAGYLVATGILIYIVNLVL